MQVERNRVNLKQNLKSAINSTSSRTFLAGKREEGEEQHAMRSLMAGLFNWTILFEYHASGPCIKLLEPCNITF